MTSRCLGNGRSDASCKQYGGVSASYKQFNVFASYKQYVSDECTYNIQSRQKHNMLSLLHAECLKLLVFFLWLESVQAYEIYSKLLAPHGGKRTAQKEFLMTHDNARRCSETATVEGTTQLKFELLPHLHIFRT